MTDTHKGARAASSNAAAYRSFMIRFAIAMTITALALLTPKIAHGQDWRTVTKTRELDRESTLRVNVEYAAGHLSIGPATDGKLYRTTLRYDADVFDPVFDYSGGKLHVGVNGGEVKGRNLKSGRLDVKLSPKVPIELDLEFGATEATIDLGGLRLRSAQIATGASKTTLNVSSLNPEVCSLFEVQVGAAKFEATGLGNLNAERMSLEGGVGEMLLDFTGQWKRDMTAKIDMGLGSLTIQVPRGLGVKITKDGLLASFDSQGLTKRGNSFYSENYEKSSRKLTINLDAALGSIRVVWVGN